MYIELDEGYTFGLGLFETIHIFKNKALFLKEHLDRLNISLEKLAINVSKISEKEVLDYLEENKDTSENGVLKIIISEKNKIFLKREYIYTEKHYERGFKLNISSTQRNESSIFTYHKTLNYADNIYEKRKSIKLGYDEPIFLNSKKCITEGATSNIFFIKNGEIFTPKLSCGLLDGIIRQWLMKNYKIREIELNSKDIKFYDEAFISNSLLGIMPVSSIETTTFQSREKSMELLKEYRYLGGLR